MKEKNPLAMLIMASKNKKAPVKDTEEKDEENVDSEVRQDAGQSLLDAIDSRDAEAIVEAIKTITNL